MVEELIVGKQAAPRSLNTSPIRSTKRSVRPLRSSSLRFEDEVEDEEDIYVALMNCNQYYGS